MLCLYLSPLFPVSTVRVFSFMPTPPPALYPLSLHDALPISVAPFQLRHNARCTTLESLERSSMQFKLSTLIRSESQSEKCSGRVRVGGDASFSPALHVGLVVPPWAEYLSADSR